ncbi:MAG TPA: PrsW family glutamic-type intramembrane protease [Candidatus Paceibacterota bacterium]|nr:PrsW family glutamic-type intramembrane protease [Candidatus Paceibacterota bacterium]
MAGSITYDNVFWSLLAGILPALFWLWFWLREDRKNPEPRSLLLKTFLAGTLSVFPAFALQQFFAKGVNSEYLLIFIIWPLTEELVKYFTAYFVALRTKDFDEPIDAIIYLITAALGFAAAENFFFLVKPTFSIMSLITANMRFIGATLLHLLTSATVGSFIALNFYKDKAHKKISLILGLLTATVLHSLFNAFIIKDNGGNIFAVFSTLWLFTIALLLLCEKIKSLKK